jgi:hypothetical protein
LKGIINIPCPINGMFKALSAIAIPLPAAAADMHRLVSLNNIRCRDGPGFNPA